MSSRPRDAHELAELVRASGLIDTAIDALRRIAVTSSTPEARREAEQALRERGIAP
jgi:hypothetical protein